MVLERLYNINKCNSSNIKTIFFSHKILRTLNHNNKSWLYRYDWFLYTRSYFWQVTICRRSVNCVWCHCIWVSYCVLLVAVCECPAEYDRVMVYMVLSVCHVYQILVWQTVQLVVLKDWQQTILTKKLFDI